jgi:phenylpropionate dioxygenase-like ring-hydroxylating dioxygenase large terminal subunit
MIRNQWYAILSSKEVNSKRPVGVTRMSEKLVLWRKADNSICCIADRCCHRGASLSCGKVIGDTVACPFHGFRYDSSGKVTMIPANGTTYSVPDYYKVKKYTVKDMYGFIWLWYGDDMEELPDISFFEDLKNNFAFGEFHEIWNVHYSRAIENQLDVVHLPFVHASTIGRGNKTLINGPVVKWSGTLMTFFVKNTEDNGQKPEKPEEINDYNKLFSLQLQMPNIWQNRVSSVIRIMAAFAPVDNENTMIYLRFYHRIVTIPVFCQLMNALGNAVNRIVLHQDRRVVLTQIPKKSMLFSDEKLVQGDLPIIEYRKMRQNLKDKNM